MALNQVVKGVDFSNQHGRPELQGNLCIRPLILDVSARYEVRHILCLRCGNRKSGYGGQDAGCAVGTECGGNGTANSSKWTLADRSRREQSGNPGRAEESDIDLVVNTEINDLHLKASALIESANQRLRPNGILMITLPVHGGWETLWIAVRAWWDRWNGGDAQFWSRQRLSALLESRGFTILESIKVRALSERRHVIVLVARKTGQSDPTCA